MLWEAFLGLVLLISFLQPTNIFFSQDGTQAALGYFKGKNTRPISAQVNCNFLVPSFWSVTLFNQYISSCSFTTRLSWSSTCSHLTQFWLLPHSAYDGKDTEPRMQIHWSHRKLMINLLISSLFCYQFLTWKDEVKLHSWLWAPLGSKGDENNVDCN